METLLVFSIALLLAVLVSKLADRSILSTAVLFLLAGFVAGQGVLGIIVIKPDSHVLSTLADLALFTVLFTDGMRVGIRDLVTAWHLPGRALLLGLPLGLAGTALIGHYIAGLDWAESFLVGAVLSPTDPLFASAIVGREEIPYRLRHLLSVESGLNDGLALPFVVGLLAYIGQKELGLPRVLGELALGVLVGILIPWIAYKLEQSRFFSIAHGYKPLFAFAVGLLVLSVTALTHANEYLAAFSAGITLATLHPNLSEEFKGFGENLAELLKLAALLIFGSLISPRFLSGIPWTGYLFAFLALVAVRPIALWLALLGTELDWPEKIAAFWFGPKGFASVVYGILVLKSGIPDAGNLFRLIAIVTATSIIAHSSTDYLVARWFIHEEHDKAKLKPA
jgi:sodium/hydrogen antiporter